MRPPFRSGSLLLPALLLPPLLALAAGCGMVDSMSGLSEARDLQATGVPARAEILAIAETGMSINDEPVVRLDVQVLPPDGRPFTATIRRLLVARVDIPQYQPGRVIAVRYDPKDPSRVSIDLGPLAAASTGNPFHDRFSAEELHGLALQAPPPAPALYRGLDPTTDTRALLENGYAPLGTAAFASPAAADPGQAAEQGRRIGAALVVLYGDSAAPADPAGTGRLAPLPYQPRLAGSAADAEAAAAATIGGYPPQPAGLHTAVYWGRTPQPPVLGISGRALSEEEKARLLRGGGMVVVVVGNGSPALAAHIQEGDVVLAIDGKPVLDPGAVRAFVESIAGRTVRFDLLRNGAPLAVEVRLNPPPAR